jgi:hypothetical protein|tara:strand:- start:189 stop:500 length:312 start_codon:yes stop_codon:yes gene_type:complete
MKFNFEKDQTVYYIDWQNKYKKIPAVVVDVRRTWATVKLNVGIFKWELTDVPMEDLEPTDDFTVTKGTALVFKNDDLNREYCKSFPSYRLTQRHLHLKNVGKY